VLARAWEAGTGFRLATSRRAAAASAVPFSSASCFGGRHLSREQIAEAAREEATERRRRTIRLLIAALKA
jgi:hypothetical protein